jgi:tRNA A-37 threonylcarbamoyl transferase component Bud32
MTETNDTSNSLGGSLRVQRESRTPDGGGEQKTLRDQAPSTAPGLQLPAQFGDYELLEEIARGGMGVVYKARHRELQRTVALKMILDSILGDTEARERFRREAQAAAALDHPNIVALHDIGSHDGRCYFSMAYVDGPNLKRSVQQGGIPAPRDAVRLLLAVTEAVDFAHQHGIVHRDLKPENVLLDGEGRPRVTDFGLAKRSGPDDPALTADGAVMGTPTYMSPEQASGDVAAIGPRSDVYSLGGILYFLLTGQPPFRGKSATEVVAQVILSEPTPPRQLNPQAPPVLEEICLKCLNKDPEERYSSAAALADDLRAVPLSGESSKTVRVSWKGGRSTTPKKRGRLWLAIAAGAALLLALAAWLTVDRWAWWKGGPPAEPTPADRPPALAVLPTPKDLRKDFGLKATILVGNNLGKEMRPAEQGDGGVIRVAPGQWVQLEIEVEKEAYVGVWTVEADGTVLQLFPNPEDPNHQFKAGEKRRVPTQGTQAEKSPNIDQVWIEASTERWDPLRGEREGPYELFKTERQLKEWSGQRRGLRLPGKYLSERVLPYQVADAP